MLLYEHYFHQMLGRAGLMFSLIVIGAILVRVAIQCTQ